MAVGRVRGAPSRALSKVPPMSVLRPPGPPDEPGPALLERLLADVVTWGDASEWLGALPGESVDLFFSSPPYADARAYSRIDPDAYVEWFMPFAAAMLTAAAPSGSFVLNIKNRVAKSGRLRGQRHPYVYRLVLALQSLGWRWLETYIWSKPNAVPGRFGPRTKDAFEYVFHFAKGERPYFELDAVRVPYKTPENEIVRRRLDTRGRRETAAGYGRDRAQTYDKGGADPGNVLRVPQTYNQHYGVEHTAPMPEGLAEFFIKAMSPVRGVVIDPFCGSATTQVVARRLGRRTGGLEIHLPFVEAARGRIARDEADDPQGIVSVAV
jgi:DNA modification methylase